LNFVNGIKNIVSYPKQDPTMNTDRLKVNFFLLFKVLERIPSAQESHDIDRNPDATLFERLTLRRFNDRSNSNLEVRRCQLERVTQG
jgi:hypothetical protein